MKTIEIYIITNDFSFNLILNRDPDTIGGEGMIYPFRHPKLGACALKLYKTKEKALKNREKVLYLMKQGTPSHNPNIKFCWPIGAAFDSRNNAFIGFVMPEAFKGSSDLSILSFYSINKTIKELYPNSPEWHGRYELQTQKGLVNRLILLCNWALALRDLYKARTICIGDIKPENVMADPLTGKISLIDIDSSQVSQNGKVIFQASAQTPNYRAPESKQSYPILESYDSFSFSICVYSILSGTHPFTNYKTLPPFDKENTILAHIKNGLYARGTMSKYIMRISGCDLHRNIERLSVGLQQLLDRTFVQPNARPSFEEWFKILKREIVFQKRSNV